MNKDNQCTPETGSLACFTMTCHSCRNECELEVKVENDDIVVSGNGCRRGIISAQKSVNSRQ